ncbi:hypothetical protein ABZ951_17760 [Streptomyces sp. NPDC046215]|uniref:hypothetical protein n=1 Tax=Streptomyces sp. NPDC046215 TaxID=3155774 RepID=UPI0033E3686C
MVADRWAQAVRRQLGLGRLLPLGGAPDGAWITESAAAGALRRAAREAGAGARLESVRLSVADPAAAARPAVPAPPSALPPGPLRVDVDLRAPGGVPLPVTADRLRTALLAAGEALGLVVESVDLRVTALLDPPHEEPDEEDEEPDEGPDGAAAAEPAGTPETPDPVAAAVLAVPGVAALAPLLGRPASAVRYEDAPDSGSAGCHVRVDIAVAPPWRALDVALAVRAAATRAAGKKGLTVAVVVTHYGAYAPE